MSGHISYFIIRLPPKQASLRNPQKRRKPISEGEPEREVSQVYKTEWVFICRLEIKALREEPSSLCLLLFLSAVCPHSFSMKKYHPAVIPFPCSYHHRGTQSREMDCLMITDWVAWQSDFQQHPTQSSLSLLVSPEGHRNGEMDFLRIIDWVAQQGDFQHHQYTFRLLNLGYHQGKW